MIADALLLVAPIRQLLTTLGETDFVPEEAKNLLGTVTEGLSLVEGICPAVTQTVRGSWSSTSGKAAGMSLENLGTSVVALTDSSVEISRICAFAAHVVSIGAAEVIAVVEAFLAQSSSLGPALLTPPGQMALLGLAAEHLNKAIHIVERVERELKGPTDELNAIAVSLEHSVVVPVPLRGASDTVGSSNGAAGAMPASVLTSIDTGSAAATGNAATSETPLPIGTEPTTGAGMGSVAFTSSGFEVGLPDGSTAAAPNEIAATAVRNALSQQGVPYVWGGTTAGVGLDCSGLTQWAYSEAGLDIPRLAQEQNIGVAVPVDQLLPGDLAVWDGHVAMYIGNGQIVEAGDPVSVGNTRSINMGMKFHGYFRPTGS